MCLKSHDSESASGSDSRSCKGFKNYLSSLKSQGRLLFVCLFFKFFFTQPLRRGFPGSSAGTESACNAGDPSSIPGSGRSAAEGVGYPLEYSWASLVVQLVKNPPSMWETWVLSLVWEDPLEKGTATYSDILVWRSPWGRKELDLTE